MTRALALAGCLCAVVATPGAAASVRDRSPAQRLLHRVAVLQKEVPHRGAYVGTDTRRRLHMRRAYWTSGMLAGSLWQAQRLRRRPDRFGRWALARTRANLGGERRDTHDLGFIYELSSVTAYGRVCRGAHARSRGCRRLRRSGLTAARSLAGLAATNRRAGTIPTHRARPSASRANTLIDSLMNLPLLYWASAQTGNPRYRRVAKRHLGVVSRELLRPDGSTFQVMSNDRSTGVIQGHGTKQGLSRASTWSRGQGWAVYGLAASAAALRDHRALVRAEQAASWVADHVPRSGVPPWDYSAGAGAATDVSAGAITAAGLYRLSALCRRMRCAHARRWRRLADRMLSGVLRRVGPDGFLGGSAGTYGRGPRWDDDAEMIYAVYYTLEALNLRRHSR